MKSILFLLLLSVLVAASTDSSIDYEEGDDFDSHVNDLLAAESFLESKVIIQKLKRESNLSEVNSSSTNFLFETTAFPRNKCTACGKNYFGSKCERCPGIFTDGQFVACGGNGQCLDGLDGNGTCQCKSPFVGSNCETCKPGYFGAECLPCPSSQGLICSGRGKCDDGKNGTGKCVCKKETHFIGGSYFGKTCEYDVCSLAQKSLVFAFNDKLDTWIKGEIDTAEIRDGARWFRVKYVLDEKSKSLWARFTSIVKIVDPDPSQFAVDSLVLAKTGDGFMEEATIVGFNSTGDKRVLLKTKSGKNVSVDFSSILLAPVKGQCEGCSPGYYGSDCKRCGTSSSSTSENDGCIHGRCDDGLMGSGHCACFRGWMGDACDKCAPGFFSRPGTSSCRPCPGYNAVVKDKRDRPTVCSGHGTCSEGINGSGRCHCHSGFSGFDCSKCAFGYFLSKGKVCTRCPGKVIRERFVPCGGNGSCNATTGVCMCNGGWAADVDGNCVICKPGFFGEFCAPCPSSSSGKICSGNGSCVDGIKGSGRCQCNDNYDGIDCSECLPGFYSEKCLPCPGDSPCSQNGTCNDGKKGDGKCECQKNWSGIDCSQCSYNYFGYSCALCPGNGNCNNHGTCHSGKTGDGVCTCNIGFAASDCSNCSDTHWGSSCTPCPGYSVDGDIVCSGNGICDSGVQGTGTCKCSQGFGGNDCKSCGTGYFGASCTACDCLSGQTCNDGITGDGTCLGTPIPPTPTPSSENL